MIKFTRLAQLSFTLLLACLFAVPNSAAAQGNGTAILEAAIDGKPVKFEQKQSAARIKEINSLTITGQTSEDIFNAEIILINITSVNPETNITKGEYKIVPEDAATGHSVRAEYFANSSGNSSYWWSNASVVKGGSIIIDEITDSSIKGRFSFTGVLETEDGSMNPKNLVKVTKGVFDLPLEVRSVLDPR